MSIRPLSLNLLVAGYIRRESHPDLPAVLTELCSNYFGNAFHWNFYSEDLKQFLSSINGEVLFSLPFKINGVVFQCSIRPNQWDETQIGFVGFKLLLKSVNNEHAFINNGDITIDYELNCTQRESTRINIKHRDKFVYKRNSNLFKFGADKMVIGSYSFYELMISAMHSRSDKSLCFGCFIDIKQSKKRKKVSSGNPNRAKKRKYNMMEA